MCVLVALRTGLEIVIFVKASTSPSLRFLCVVQTRKWQWQIIIVIEFNECKSKNMENIRNHSSAEESVPHNVTPLCFYRI